MTEPILSHTLSNGMVLVAEPMPWLRSAAFTLLVPAGCAHDPADRCGLSGFVCEMALRGAGSRDSRRLIQDLDNLGVERGDSVSEAHTRWSGATLAANLPEALTIYADVVRRPHLPVAQIEAARQVMIQECRAIEDEPSDKVMIELRRRHYPDPWGRPPQGEIKALEAVAIEDVHQHFARRYGPRGTILGVAGQFSWDRLKKLVEDLFGDWVAREAGKIVESPSPRKYTHLPFESNQTQIGVAYPSVAYRHPDYYQAWGAVGVLSGGMSARLFTEVRERRGLCYSVYAMHHTLIDRGAVFCYAGTSADRAQETLDVVLRELTRLKQGIEPRELDRLKARIKSSLVMQQESSAGRSGSLVRDWYHLGRARSLDETCALIDGLTSQSINAYLADHAPGDFDVVTLGPRKLKVPDGVS